MFHNAKLDSPGRPLLLFREHRSYRRLSVTTRRGVFQALVLLLIAEAALLRGINWLSSMTGHVALWLLPPLQPSAALVSTSYLGLRLKVLLFVLPQSTYWSQLFWLLGGALVLAAVVAVRRIPTPIRVLAGFMAVLVCASAYYVLVFGQPGFDGYEASRLYVQTEVLIWLLLPVLLTVSSIALPFTFLERLMLLVGCTVIGIVVGTIRYAFFVWIVGSVGPIPMPMLYLLFGPAFDFVYAVAIASVVLVHLSRRLDTAETAEAWSWT
jgi:hypothetical protein